MKNSVFVLTTLVWLGLGTASEAGTLKQCSILMVFTTAKVTTRVAEILAGNFGPYRNVFKAWRKTGGQVIRMYDASVASFTTNQRTTKGDLSLVRQPLYAEKVKKQVRQNGAILRKIVSHLENPRTSTLSPGERAFLQALHEQFSRPDSSGFEIASWYFIHGGDDLAEGYLWEIWGLLGKTLPSS